MHTFSVYLQIIGSSTSGGTGAASGAISSAGSTIDTILIAVIGVLTAMIILLWIGAKMFASVVQILESHLPWISIPGLGKGLEMHKAANSAILKLLIEAPLVIFGAVLVGHIVQQITGFSIPLDIPNLSSLGH